MPQTHGDVLLHLVFSTKNRQPLIGPASKSRLHGYLGGILREMKGYPIIINGMPDHVHLLGTIPLTKSIADLVRELKTNSSKWMHDQNLGQNFEWQRGYGVFSVSRSNLEKVSKYIENQEFHHKNRSFQEEYLWFLKELGLEYDPRYIWD
ncbi:MAG: IS200/IS605 family transposase [Blastocatellia bacterium]|nr:IS200/IS605 family transposase [Blastocatellia bacterium]